MDSQWNDDVTIETPEQIDLSLEVAGVGLDARLFPVAEQIKAAPKEGHRAAPHLEPKPHRLDAIGPTCAEEQRTRIKATWT